MNKPQKTSRRLTLYVKPEHQELVQWAKEYTHTSSASEAIFTALGELKLMLKEKQLQALDDIHGIWKDDPQIDEALKELDTGWEGWSKQVEKY